MDLTDNSCRLLDDVNLLELLNGLGLSKSDGSPTAADEIAAVAGLAEEHVRARLDTLKLPFTRPSVRLQLVMWPARNSAQLVERETSRNTVG